MWLSVACASGVWAAVAWMEGSIPGGMLLFTIAAAALRLASWHGSERKRLRGLVGIERQYEPVRVMAAAGASGQSQNDKILWLTLGVAVISLAAALWGVIWVFTWALCELHHYLHPN